MLGCLRETKLEIERLHIYPFLFPSREIRNAFDHDMRIIFSGALKYNGPEGEEIREKEKQQLLQTVWQESGYPAFTEQDPRRKPWQQYLHDRAPGAGLDPSFMLDGQTNQVMPHAALRIWQSWGVEWSRIYSGIKEVSFSLKSHAQRHWISFEKLMPPGFLIMALADLLDMNIGSPREGNPVYHGKNL